MMKESVKRIKQPEWVSSALMFKCLSRIKARTDSMKGDLCDIGEKGRETIEKYVTRKRSHNTRNEEYEIETE